MDRKTTNKAIFQLTQLIIEKISDDIGMIIEYNSDDLKHLTFKMIDAYNTGIIDLTQRSEVIHLISLIEENYVKCANCNLNSQTFVSSQPKMITLLPIIKQIIELMNLKVTRKKFKKSFKDDYYPVISDQSGGHLYNKQYGIIYLVK